MTKKHARLSASGSAKWLNCAGSIIAEEAIPNTTNEFAELGTLAHELADTCLSNNQDTIEWIDREISCESDGKVLKIVVDEEMAKYVQEYLDYVLAHETNDSELYTEERVDFSNIVPDGFGTMDSGILDYITGTLHVFDLKYGMTPVFAEGNTQGRFYLLGLYNELKFLNVIKSFKIHIVQPRRYSITSEEISMEELIKFGEHAKVRALLALAKNAKRTPGEKQCEWCDARFTCTVLDKFTHDITKDAFENLDKVKSGIESEPISNDRIKLILDNKKLIEKFLKNIEAHSLERLQNGENIPGYKLVRKKSNRKWIEKAEKTLVRLLGKKEAYESKLIGITTAEKKLDKKQVDKLTSRPEGPLDIAKESDKRPGVTNIIDEFETIKEKDNG